ncbi:recombinase family protein [Lysinibacillus fusiformis]|uniref:recombinase family protein n=1 Tax=Lysinibacillus fusiformis TaxID=28031 RepID=UPI00301A6EEB
MDDKASLRVFLYIRVSTIEQAKEGYSVGAQEERLRAYAKAKNYTVVKTYIDPAYSGSNMNRPALQEMIKQVELGATDLVLVYKLDRLSRSQKDTLFLIEDVFLKNSVDFVSMNESFDTSTPFGRAMIGILSVFAQLEREQIRERTMMGKEERAKEGKWHGGGGKSKTAKGYDYIDGQLKINNYEAECVKTIYEEYLRGNGTNKIFHLVLKKYPGFTSTETTVRNILTNPIYAGKIKHKNDLYEGEHPPIITLEQYDQVQNLMKKRASTSDPSRKQYLLTGLLFCGHCGARLFGRTGGKLKSGKNVRYYSCYSRQKTRKHMIRDENCKKSHEQKDILEQHVIDEIKKINISYIEEYRIGEGSEVSRKIESLVTETLSIDKQISKLVDLYSLDDTPIEIVGKKIKILKEERAKIEQHITEIKNEQIPKNYDEIKKTVSQLATFNWDNEETDQKRLIVAKLINKIIVSNDNIIIDWTF